MPKRNRRKLGSRQYKNYTEEMLQLATNYVQKNEMSSTVASQHFNIPRRTIENKVKKLHLKVPGGQVRFTDAEEGQMVQVLIAAADFGSPLTELDLRLTVFEYLKKNSKESLFNNKPPGKWWVKNFLYRHKNELTTRSTQNIKRARAEKTADEFLEYFNNLKETLKDVPKECILNYDETNLSDNPGAVKCIFKRKVKYPERIINQTKGSISIMFAACGDGTLLPPYVVYKADHLWQTWVENGPSKARYNRTKSGWFDAFVFEDWFKTVVIPWADKSPGPKVVIGDNLSSHLNVEILELCIKHHIRFAFLPPHSTHISQPLDVAFFAPLKKHWRRILTQYKIENPTESNMNKSHFPALLKKLIDVIEINKAEVIKSGFKATGIIPYNPHKVLSKLPDYDENEKYSIDSALLKYLKENRAPKPITKTKNKKINILPGASISSEEIAILKEIKTEKENKMQKPNKRESNKLNKKKTKISIKLASQIEPKERPEEVTQELPPIDSSDFFQEETQALLQFETKDPKTPQEEVQQICEVKSIERSRKETQETHEAETKGSLPEKTKEIYNEHKETPQGETQETQQVYTKETCQEDAKKTFHEETQEEEIAQVQTSETLPNIPQIDVKHINATQKEVQVDNKERVIQVIKEMVIPEKRKICVLSCEPFSPLKQKKLKVNMSSFRRIGSDFDVFKPKPSQTDVNTNEHLNPVPSTSGTNLKNVTHSPIKLKKNKTTTVSSDDESDFSLHDSSEGEWFNHSDTSAESQLDDETETSYTVTCASNCVNGTFVLVKFTSKKTVKYFVGQIVETSDNGYFTKFMRRKTENIFCWPIVEDISFIYNYDIEKILNNPQELRRGMLRFRDVNIKKYNVQ